MRKLLIIIGAIVLVVGVAVYMSGGEKGVVDMALEKVMVTKEMEIEMKEMKYDYMGELLDVTGGSAMGSAKATYESGKYYMMATFADLPALEEGYFYEGWVVRKEPFHFISTGEIENNENVFMDTKDWIDHDQYVLTLEPDDGDPAPAAHILEGMMLFVN